MSDRAPQNNELRRVMDACLPGLEDRSDFDRNVLQQVRGEIKVKKRLSVGFVLVIVLILVIATALALVTLRETAPLIAQTEQDDGYFSDWPVEKKIEVISALIEEGYIEETDDIKQIIGTDLSQDEKSRIADEAIAKFVGQDANEVGFLTIMQAAWGPFDKWTYEEKAWYSQLMEDVGVDSDGKTVYVEPTGTVDEQKALAIARSAIAKGYGVDESVLDDYSYLISFEIPESAEPGDTQSYWHVTYTAPGDLPQENGLFDSFGDIELFIHPETGELLQSVEEIRAIRANLPNRPTNALYQAIDAYYARAKEMGVYAFREWPLELQAEYSQEITPKVQAIVASGDLTDLMNCGSPDVAVMAQSTYIYGVPQADAISQDEAFTLAKAALEKNYNLASDLFEKYRETDVYYDITDANVPLWKFFFNPKSLPAKEYGYDNPLRDLCYKVVINSHTGEIVHIEEFPFQTLGHELAYDLKWY
jgi:hypothetical protein